MNTTQATQINDLLQKLDIDIYNIQDIETIEDLNETVMQLIHEKEVVYYYKANKILSNDNNLEEAVELAIELGFDLTTILEGTPDYNLANSELLATIFIQDQLLQEYYNIESELGIILQD